jgi:hypothetical protein
MRLISGGMLIECDEKRTVPCPATIRVEFAFQAPIDQIVDAARNSGWRCYSSAHRRDLCPDHRDKARRRVHLVGRTM